MKTVAPSRRFRDGRIDWHVPGAPHPITYCPKDSRWGAPSLSWPARDPRGGGWVLRAARLDWHKGVAKAELRKLLDELPHPVANFSPDELRLRLYAKHGRMPA